MVTVIISSQTMQIKVLSAVSLCYLFSICFPVTLLHTARGGAFLWHLKFLALSFSLPVFPSFLLSLQAKNFQCIHRKGYQEERFLCVLLPPVQKLFSIILGTHPKEVTRSHTPVIGQCRDEAVYHAINAPQWTRPLKGPMAYVFNIQAGLKQGDCRGSFFRERILGLQ